MLLPLCCATLLTACGTSSPPPLRVVTDTRVEKKEVDPALFDCGKRPLPGVIEDQAEVAIYLKTLTAWGMGCDAKLQAIKTTLGIP